MQRPSRVNGDLQDASALKSPEMLGPVAHQVSRFVALRFL